MGVLKENEPKEPPPHPKNYYSKILKTEMSDLNGIFRL